MSTSQPFDLSAELEHARRAVRAAALVTRAVQADLVHASTLEKSDKSPVTVADFASQAVVAATLSLSGSAVRAMVGEEDAADLRGEDATTRRGQVVQHARGVLGAELSEEDVLGFIDLGGHTPPLDAGGRASGTYWTLDPIDGTKGFLRSEQYAIALALIHDGQVVVGALGCPRLPVDMDAEDEGVLMLAARGQGAFSEPLFRDGKRVAIRVSTVQEASQARFCESVEAGHSDQDQSAQIAQALGITAPGLRMDSQAKYAGLARGDASIYLRLPTRKDYQEKIWDHAAGLIVVEEAGGRVTDVRGAPLDFGRGGTLAGNSGVIATNGPIHDEVLAAVMKVLG
ncbi:MAG: 3'(2'),5'-bisphosphate nucleotidase [Sandaracinaceae bacterium]|nr:3'(2'),5'-bisphosphate nucleotidase [Sandaracinaceae bacterium]